MARFLHERGIPPVLVVLDFDAGAGEKLAGTGPGGPEILVEPSHEEILARLRALRVDLIIGGMAERPLAALLGVPLLDMMHGSQRTACFEGERELARILAGVLPREDTGQGPSRS
jgi:nitrogenase molybdenum-iron protein alpha/beta subunit